MLNQMLNPAGDNCKFEILASNTVEDCTIQCHLCYIPQTLSPLHLIADAAVVKRHHLNEILIFLPALHPGQSAKL